MQGDSLIVLAEDGGRDIQSYPLNDYVDVGVFGADEDGEEVILYFKRHKFTTIDNTIKITVDQEPSEVGIDPYNKLIDTNSEDNRRVAEEE